MLFRSDYEAVEKLTSEHGILLPENGKAIIAERNDLSISGIVNIRQVCMIEPLISESPLVTYELFENAVDVVRSLNKNIIRGIVKKDNKIYKLAKRIGFYDIFEDHCIVELDVTNILKKENKLKLKIGRAHV